MNSPSSAEPLTQAIRGCARFTILSNEANKSASEPVAELTSMQSIVAAGGEKVGRNRLVGQSSPAPRRQPAAAQPRNKTNIVLTVLSSIQSDASRGLQSVKASPTRRRTQGHDSLVTRENRGVGDGNSLARWAQGGSAIQGEAAGSSGSSQPQAIAVRREDDG